MKKWLSYGMCFVILAGAAALAISSPDWLSALIVGVMTAIILAGEIFGVFPLIQYISGFENAMANIRKAQELQSSMPWIAIQRLLSRLSTRS